MATGRRAFQGTSTISTLAAILHQQPTPVREIVPVAPPELDRLIARCLRKDPDRRIQHMDDVKLATRRAEGRVQRRDRGLRAAGRAEAVLTPITADSGLSFDPALSPDGKLLAYASDRGGEGHLDIWVQQVGGGEPVRLTRHEAND